MSDFVKVTQARDILLDPVLRKIYDKSGMSGVRKQEELRFKYKYESYNREYWEKVRKGVFYGCCGVACLCLAVAGTAIALGAAGFTSAGIAAGSLAAGW